MRSRGTRGLEINVVRRGSVNLGVIRFMNYRQISLRTLLGLIAFIAILVAVYPFLFPKSAPGFTPEGYLLDSTALSPACSIYWFKNEDGEIVSGVASFGANRPRMMVSHNDGTINVPAKNSPRIRIPRDGRLYILGPGLEIHETDAKIKPIAAAWQNYSTWSKPLLKQIELHAWP